MRKKHKDNPKFFDIPYTWIIITVLITMYLMPKAGYMCGV